VQITTQHTQQEFVIPALNASTFKSMRLGYITQQCFSTYGSRSKFGSLFVVRVSKQIQKIYLLPQYTFITSI